MSLPRSPRRAPAAGPAATAALTLAAVLATGTALAGCGRSGTSAEQAVAQAAAAEVTPGATVTPDSKAADAGPADVSKVKLTPDGRTLVVGFSAPPCRPVSSAWVQEAMLSVNVSVHLGKAAGDCDQAAVEQWTPVTLKNPLSGRLVLDIDRGRQLKVERS